MAVRVGGVVLVRQIKNINLGQELLQKELQKELLPLGGPQPQQKEATKIHAQKIEIAREKKYAKMDHANNAGTKISVPRIGRKRNVLGELALNVQIMMTVRIKTINQDVVKKRCALKNAYKIVIARIPKNPSVRRTESASEEVERVEREVEAGEEVEVRAVFFWMSSRDTKNMTIDFCKWAREKMTLKSYFLGCSKNEDCRNLGNKKNCDSEFGECYNCNKNGDCRDPKFPKCKRKKCKADKEGGEGRRGDGEESSSAEKKKKSCNWEEASFFSFCTAKTIYKYSKPGYKVDSLF